MLLYAKTSPWTFKVLFLLLLFGFTESSKAELAGDDVRGLYNAVLTHEGTNFYQHAKLTLRTTNINGQLRVSANVKILFGDVNSNEYLTYEYPEVPLNLLTRELNIKQDGNDVTMIGALKNGAIEGEWFSTQVGRVGTFKAQKVGMPAVPENGILVKTLSGYYRGSLTNTNPQSNLPEQLSMSFVTTQDTAGDGTPTILISGTARFYFGKFDSLEFVETPFTNIQFNFYTRYMTAKTRDYGLTVKGTMTPDGRFNGVVLSDALGQVATVSLATYP